MEVVEEYMRSAHAIDMYPDKFICHAKQGNEVDIEDEGSGKRYRVLTFCTNDVLGLTQCEAVRQAAVDSIHQYGTSNSSCSVLSGRIDLHRQLEEEISSFKHLPHTQLFMNAWMALQALMDGFCHLAAAIPGFENKRETLILTDVLNHGSIVSAVVNAGNRSGKMFGHSPKVRVKAYRHCDMQDLQRKLQRHAGAHDRIVVISDAVFSMDGDIVPLPVMLSVMEAYPGSIVVLDEAHASGSIGKQGGGIYDHFNISPQSVIDRSMVPIILTTFSKFAASAGAAISSHSRALVELLDVCPTSVGTISLPAPTAAAALESIRIVRRQPDLVARLQENTRYLRGRLVEAGFEIIGETNVIPVILPTGVDPKPFSRYLIDRFQVWVSPIWFIAKPRLRITVNVLHDRTQMDRLMEAIIAAREHFYPAAEASTIIASG